MKTESLSKRSILPLTAYRLSMPVRVYHHLWRTHLDGVVVNINAKFLTVEIDQMEPGLAGPVIVTAREVQPVLRKLETITEVEARKCYSLLNGGEAFDSKPRYEGDKRHYAKEEMTAIEYLDGMQDSELGLAISRITVADYLDSVAIDTRGWIDAGLAIDKDTVEPNVVKKLSYGS